MLANQIGEKTLLHMVFFFKIRWIFIVCVWGAGVGFPLAVVWGLLLAVCVGSVVVLCHLSCLWDLSSLTRD